MLALVDIVLWCYCLGISHSIILQCSWTSEFGMRVPSYFKFLALTEVVFRILIFSSCRLECMIKEDTQDVLTFGPCLADLDLLWTVLFHLDVDFEKYRVEIPSASCLIISTLRFSTFIIQ